MATRTSFATGRGTGGGLLTLGVQGVDGAMALLREIEGIAGTSLGVQLRSKARLPAGKRINGTIVDALIGAGRDFFGPSEEDVSEVARVFTDVVRARLQTIARSALRSGKNVGGSGVRGILSAAADKSGRSRSTEAENVARGALRKGMLAWMGLISGRLDAQTTAAGGRPAEVDKKYAERRREKYGVPEDVVGKATGQLLDNLGPSGANISFVRGEARGVAGTARALGGQVLSRGARSFARRLGVKK